MFRIILLLVALLVQYLGVNSMKAGTNLATFNAALSPFFKSVNVSTEIEKRAQLLIKEVCINIVVLVIAVSLNCCRLKVVMWTFGVCKKSTLLTFSGKSTKLLRINILTSSLPQTSQWMTVCQQQWHVLCSNPKITLFAWVKNALPFRDQLISSAQFSGTTLSWYKTSTSVNW